MKNRFSKNNFSSNYSTLPAERIFDRPTVKNLPQGREVLAQRPETMKKSMLSQKTFHWFLTQSTQFVKPHRQVFDRTAKFDSLFRNPERQVVKIIYFPKMLLWTRRMRF